MPNVTALLGAIRAGDERANADLFALVYDELKRIAAAYMAGEDSAHTLQPTALVHEAYLRLLGKNENADDPKRPDWDGRGHFFAAAAETMRRILIDAARRRKTQKRGGDRLRLPVDLDELAQPQMADKLLALDEALTELSVVQPKIAELVKLRYFGGLTIQEVAAALSISPRTADSYWAYARVWLLARLEDRQAMSE